MRTVDAAGLAIGDEAPPRVMGVVNVSPSSPYTPSVHESPNDAAAYADSLIAEGADIIDIGLESANKRFPVRSAEWELDRLQLALETLDRIEGDAVFSIETRYAAVAEAGLDGGFDMVNDICGFADPRMPEVCAARDVAVVKMAGPGDLERPGALETVDEIYDALADEVTAKTIIDPAFGQWSGGKTLAADHETFRRLREFRAIGQPVLVSINRKNFIRKPLGRSTEDALPGSLAATSMAVERGAHVIRTHDVRATVDAASVGDRLARPLVRSGRIEELGVTTVREAERYLDALGLDPGRAPASVATAFHLSELQAEEQDALTTAAAGVDVVVEVADGRAFLAGTAAGLDEFARQLGGLEDVAAGIREAV